MIGSVALTRAEISRRYNKRKQAKHKCPRHPRRNAVPGQTECQECRDYRKQQSKRLRARLKKAGKCIVHSDQVVAPGERCPKCKAYDDQHDKELLAAGKCVNHSDRDVVPGKTMCQECLDYHKDFRKPYSDKLKAAGKCINHPDHDVVPGLAICQECRDQNRQRTEECKAAGKCPGHPDRDVAPGCQYCQECLDNGAVHAGVRRARKNSVPSEQVDRLVVFERDNWKCQRCDKTVDSGNGEADHIVPLSLGGPHTYWNHQTLCERCNGLKQNHIRKEPRLAHLLHLPIKKLIEAFAKEQGATLPRVWWAQRQRALRKAA